MVGDVVHTLDHLGLEEVVLLGHSMGGRLSVPLAVKLGARCRGLVIEDMDMRPRRGRIASAQRLKAMEGFRREHKVRKSVVKSS